MRELKNEKNHCELRQFLIQKQPRKGLLELIHY